VITVTSYPDDGRPRREVQALVEAGYQVAVVCGQARRRPRRETMNGVQVFRFRNPLYSRDARIQVSDEGRRAGGRRVKGVLGYLLGWGGSTLAAFFLSVRLVRSPGFDVIHVHNPPDTLALAALVFRPFGRRLVYDHHDLAPEMYYARTRNQGRRSVYRVLLLLERLSLRVSDQVITTNESYRRLEIERGRVSPHKVQVVRNGPEADLMSSVGSDPAIRGRARWILGYVGVMGPQDGVDHLLRALRHLIDDHRKRDILCVLVGAGDAWDQLQGLATKLNLREHTHFTGWLPRDEAMRVIASLDVGVEPAPSNPYNDRSTMVKVMEYMAFGKPVVAYDLPENRFTARSAAIYAPANDELELARATADLLDQPERREAMGAAGRERVEAELAWRHSVPRLLDAYRRVAPLP
jgi:glycosyltransferase involved in cell wall biosynthesis